MSGSERAGAVQSGIQQNISAVHLDGHLTRQTSRRTNRHTDTYIQSPDGQTDRAFLFPLLLAILSYFPKIQQYLTSASDAILKNGGRPI